MSRIRSTPAHFEVPSLAHGVVLRVRLPVRLPVGEEQLTVAFDVPPPDEGASRRRPAWKLSDTHQAPTLDELEPGLSTTHTLGDEEPGPPPPMTIVHRAWRLPPLSCRVGPEHPAPVLLVEPPMRWLMMGILGLWACGGVSATQKTATTPEVGTDAGATRRDAGSPPSDAGVGASLDVDDVSFL
jgi:hypothetical protein